MKRPLTPKKFFSNGTLHIKGHSEGLIGGFSLNALGEEIISSFSLTVL